MSPDEFAMWAFVWLLVAVFGLGILAAAIAAAVTGVGVVIEWFDKRRERRRAVAYRREGKTDGAL